MRTKTRNGFAKDGDAASVSAHIEPHQFRADTFERMDPDWPDRSDRYRGRRVAWMIADFGWENPLPEESDITRLLSIDDDIPDGYIHIFEGDPRFYISCRTAERRVTDRTVVVSCPETGELVADAVGDHTALSDEPAHTPQPYIASRRSGLA